MGESVYVNAMASQCAATVSDRARGVVRHGGGLYSVVGLYFAHGSDGRRLLYYILRALRFDGDEASALLFVR